jgi:hypothetical protein
MDPDSEDTKYVPISTSTIAFGWNDGDRKRYTVGSLMLSGIVPKEVKRDGMITVHGNVLQSNEVIVTQDITNSFMFNVESYMSHFKVPKNTQDPQGEMIDQYKDSDDKYQKMLACVSDFKGTASRIKAVDTHKPPFSIEKEFVPNVLCEKSAGFRVLALGAKKNPQIVAHMELAQEKLATFASPGEHRATDFTTVVDEEIKDEEN